jgi:hypothetical protein
MIETRKDIRYATNLAGHAVVAYRLWMLPGRISLYPEKDTGPFNMFGPDKEQALVLLAGWYAEKKKCRDFSGFL